MKIHIYLLPLWVLAWLLSAPLLSLAQTVTVEGTVQDENDEGLPGVTITVKNTTRGTTTDVDGRYRISVNSEDVLVFSSVGFDTEEVTVGTQTVINISMVPDITALDEIVVVGYGAVQKRDLTGSVSSVKLDEVKGQPINSLDQVLQGRAAGVVFNQASGKPGGLTTIRIRGSSSINASNEPLYVIDGIPIINDDDGASAGAARGSALNALANLNPNDIESIEILKDASSTAIYGARGANGVVLITTKRGKKGQATFNFDAYYGVQETIKKLDLLNAREYGYVINEARYAAGQPPLYDIDTLGEGTDWQDELFRIAPIQNYSLSTSGGGEKNTYAISASYFSQDGIIRKSDFERYSFRVNLDSDITDWLKIGNNLSASYLNSRGVLTEDNTILTGAVTAATRFNPIQGVYNSSGDYTFVDSRDGTLGNPIAEIDLSDNERSSARVLGNLFADIQLLEGLTARISLGADMFFNKEDLFVPPGLFKTRTSEGDANVGTRQGITLLNENTLTYDNSFGKHAFNALVGVTAQSFRSELLNTAVIGFSTIGLRANAIQVADETVGKATYVVEAGLVSYLARVNYKFDDRYLFTLTGRVDGSSKFGPGNRYAFFPSGAFAWRVSNEPFMQDISGINDLKLRASYGFSGNQEIPANQAVSLLSTTQVVFDDANVKTGFVPINLANRNLKWETTAQLDVGVDFTLFDRLSITADYYIKKTSDILVAVPVASTSGFTSAYDNIGDLENKGFELSITAGNQFGDFRWDPSFNISFNKSKVLDLKGNDRITNDFGNLLGMQGWQVVFEGEELGTHYGYVFDGIIQSDENLEDIPRIPSNPNIQPGDKKYKDLNNDGLITEEDKTIIGYAQPDYVFGFTNNFSYKGFDLNIFIQGSVGKDIANFNRVALTSLNGISNDLREAAANAWTPTNPSNEYPRIAQARTDLNGPGSFNSYFVEDGSYVRLKNLSLGYTFSNKLLSNIGLASLRCYVAATNLWTLTDYSGYDPELTIFANDNLSQGADYGGYPTAKMYTVGLSIGL